MIIDDELFLTLLSNSDLTQHDRDAVLKILAKSSHAETSAIIEEKDITSLETEELSILENAGINEHYQKLSLHNP